MMNGAIAAEVTADAVAHDFSARRDGVSVRAAAASGPIINTQNTFNEVATARQSE